MLKSNLFNLFLVTMLFLSISSCGDDEDTDKDIATACTEARTEAEVALENYNLDKTKENCNKFKEAAAKVVGPCADFLTNTAVTNILDEAENLDCDE